MATHRTLQIIRSEHAALAAVLRSLLMLLAHHRRRRTLPDFALLRAMLFYVDEFPEQRHHRRESELLFPKLRARTLLARGVLDTLEEEHRCGEARIRALEHALLAFEVLGEPRRAAFEEAAQRYADFYLAHMSMEERRILPLAERVLTADDWAELDAHFERNGDPLAESTEPDGEPWRTLFTRIVNTAPAPIGLGAAA
jgi:hemerythrin-like domain-containing protein